MNKEMVVLQGKMFTIELQSMLGSTLYGWCLSELPKGIMLVETERIPTAPGVAPVIQKFHFGVSSTEEVKAEIVFVLASHMDFTDTKSEYRVNVTSIPGSSEEFVAYSDNLNANALYGFVCDASKAALPYGFVRGLGADNAQIPYGMVYTQDATMKYGYPCGMQDASMKYGYPCGVQDASMKYGYPCGMQDASMKYGYPGCC